MSAFRFLAPYFRRNLSKLLLGVSALLAVDFLQLLIPRVLKHAVDDLAAMQATGRRLLFYAAAIMVLALGIALFRFVWRRALLGHSRIIETELRNRLFAHLQTLSPGYFDKTPTGDLMALATNDIQAVQLATGMGLVALTDSIVLGTAAVGFMLYINVTLTLVALIPMPLIALFTRFFSRVFHQRFQQVQAAFATLTERARENIAGIRLVKAYAQEEAESRRFDAAGRSYVQENLKMARISGLFSPMSLLLSQLSMALILAVGGRLVIGRTISVGDFVAFTSYVLLLTWPMMALGWMINLYQRGAASLARIQRILATEREMKDDPRVPDPGPIRGRIEVRQLDFSYPGSQHHALRRVNFCIEPGSFVGLVGMTGAGKSTLIRLLLRLYPVPEGRIYFDGIDINHLPLGRLRGTAAVVPQEPFVFADTIRANLCFGRPNATDTELITVLQAVHLWEEVKQFPAGLDTLLGERGINLSGGQKQRLTLARALLLERPLLLMDDCLSAVDMETEAAILANLEAFVGGRTTIVASHRLEIMRRADLILVLDSGEIREQGRHFELMAVDGLYATLYRRQQLQTELEMAAPAIGAR